MIHLKEQILIQNIAFIKKNKSNLSNFSQIANSFENIVIMMLVNYKNNQKV